MKKLGFFVLLFSASFYFFFFNTQPTFASEKFETSYNVSYKVLETGITRVSLSVKITNKTKEYYTPSYKIALGYKDIQNLSVYDSDGVISSEVIKNDEGSVIDLAFKNQVVGLSATRYFVVLFDTQNVAKKRGSIWEVYIPGLSNKESFDEFNVALEVPLSFGKPSFIKSNTSSYSDLSQESQTIRFTKDDIGKSGIIVAYGQSQTYAFELVYHLKNRNLFPVRTEIALPPTTNYQDVLIEGFSKSPQNVLVDTDGNWLAQYYLLPSEKINIVVKGKAKVYYSPKKETLSQEKINEYLKPLPYWQVNDEMKKTAKALGVPKAIYEYVVKTLEYDYSRVEQNLPRLGAENALKNKKSAVCLEFTDLFIALARASGIPAREVNGFGYTENSKLRPLSLIKDVLHAWPEYYDFESQTWIMIDPTWANTTSGTDYFSVLDFDHFTLVKKGINSSYPIPAGGYKYKEYENSKDVHVEFDKEDYNFQDEKLEIDAKIPTKVLSGLPIQGMIILKNNGSVLVSSQKVEVSSSTLYPKKQTLYFDKIPPRGTTSKTISFEKTSFLTNKKEDITIRVGNQNFAQTILISPIAVTKWTLIGGGVIVSAGIILSLIGRSFWRIYIQRQKGKDPLRRESK